MIVGIGVDLVDIPRFERTLARTPRLLERLFSGGERSLKPHSLAARYAAKEAFIKALGGSDGVHWTEIEITSEDSGRPVFSLTGSTAAVVASRGITGLHLSLSHDAGLATAYVVAEARDGAGPEAAPTATPGAAPGAAPAAAPETPKQGIPVDTGGVVPGLGADPLSREHGRDGRAATGSGGAGDAVGAGAGGASTEASA